MPEAYIFDHVRTPRGKGKVDGALHEVTAIALGTTPLKALKARNYLPENHIDDVIMGCVDPVGEAGADIARTVALNAGYGHTVPGVQVNRFCASGLDAVSLGAGQIIAGMKDLIVAGGVESMSRVGMGASGFGIGCDPSVAIDTYFMPQGIAADLIATKYGFSRENVDAYAALSHQRAAAAWKEGRFLKSVIPVTDINGMTILDKDETIRPDTTVATLAGLKPSFVQMGEMGGFDAVATYAHPDVEKINHIHHAGNSSGIVDGAAAVLIGSKAAGRALGLKPRARIRAFATIGSDLALMLTGPVDVTQLVLKKAKMNLSDIDVIEINEAFSSVVLRFLQAFNLDETRVNVNGGAIAMGHPLGATGAMILGTALDELERTGKSVALITLCVAVGMGVAMIIERV
jgi:acetyl-CoA C-acetyltransferase